jgi:hypothetical protein
VTVLRSKVLTRPRSLRWWLSAAGVVAVLRLLGVLALSSTGLGVPDEGLYQTIVDQLGRGVDIYSLGVALGYGPVVITGSWLLLLPALTLSEVGVNSLLALRLTSVLYATAASLLFIVVTWLLRAGPHARGSNRENRVNVALPVASTPGFSIIVLLALPSHAVWTTLALRDSSSLFSITLVAAGVALVVSRTPGYWRLIGPLCAGMGLVGLQLSRSYLSALALIAVLSICLWLPRHKRPVLSVALALFSLCGFLGGQAIRGMFSDAPDSPSVVEPSVVGTSFPQAALAQIDSRVGTFSVNRLKFMEDADTAYAYNYCETETQLVDIALCEAVHLPIGVGRFLTLPHTLPWDVPDKAEQALAGIENYVWVLLFLLVVGTLAARKSVNSRMTTFLVVYGSLALVGYSLVSGNAGTAFRHKSQFLWVFTLIIALGADWRPWARRLSTGVLRHRARSDSVSPQHPPVQGRPDNS